MDITYWKDKNGNIYKIDQDTSAGMSFLNSNEFVVRNTGEITKGEYINLMNKLNNNQTNKYCFRCGTELQIETDEELSKEYPYYCEECDENMYEFETMERAQNKKGVI